MGTRTSLSVGVAVALIVLPVALLAGYRHWLDTRTFNPLDTPVSLSRGHIRTGDFYINLKGQYYAGISVDYAATYTPGCTAEAWESLRTHSTAYENSVKIGESDGPIYGSVGVLDVDKAGYYSLDVEVLSDAGCLNASHPRLRVWNRSDFPYDDLYQTAVWTVPITVAAGLGLLVYTASLATWSATTKPYAIVEVDARRVTTGRPLRRPPIRALMSGLPSFGLLYATVLAFFVLIMMILTAPIPPKGIWVSIRSAFPDMTSAGTTEPPIVLRIEDAGPNSPYRLYVSSRLVPRTELENALKDELKRRPDWVVNVEADPNLPWMAVADAVDCIKGMHAKAVLLTPETSTWMHKRYTENAESRSPVAVRRRH